MSGDYGNIPEELRALPQWVVWRREDRDGKSTKVPYQVGGRHASTTDPATWTTFDRVVSAATAGAGFDGIGFVFSPEDPFAGLDFDHCLSAGEVAPWFADRAAGLAPTYAEVSPSGQGVKVWVRAVLPGPGTRRNGFGGDRAGAVEIYDRGRFFTVTGDLWDDAECTVLDRQEAVTALYREIRPERPRPAASPEGPRLPLGDDIDDDAVIRRLARPGVTSANPDVQAFRTLFYAGDPSPCHGDDSEADFLLCKLFASVVGDDAPRIERLFRRSELANREKWANRPKYRRDTIAAAIVDALSSPDMRDGKDIGDRIDDWDRGGGVLSPMSLPSRYAGEWDAPLISPPVDVPPFPLDVFPADLAGLCLASSLAMSVPVDYFGMLALGVAGAAAGQATTLALKPTWEEAPNLYVCVLGDPGTKKSPALKVMAGPLWTLDRELRAKAKANREAWTARKRAAERAKQDFDEDEPPRLRLVTDDATKESLARMLHANPRGMALVKDELTSLVASLNAYRGGKGDDLQFYMKLNTRTFVAVDRVKDQDNPIVMQSPCLTILGCMTPGTIANLAGDRLDNGWLDRFVFSYPVGVEAATEWGACPRVDDRLKEAWRAAIRHIHGWPHDESMPGFEPIRVKLSDAGTAAWSDFYRAHHAEVRDEEFPRSLRGPWSKLEGFAARVALTLALLRWAYAGDERGAVEGPDVEGAARLIAYFKACFRRVKAELSGGAIDADDDTRAVLLWLRRDRVGAFTVRAVLRKFRMLDRLRRDEILAWLVDRNYLRPIPAGPKVGRPSIAYAVNPHLWGESEGCDDADG
jgi:hypothetical protein